jgi:hypothetical protein
MRKSIMITSVVLFVLMIVVLVLVLRGKDKEHFRKCICGSDQGGREEDCQDTDLVQKLYDSGKLTESTNLVSHGWSTTSPGDVNWPESKGCGYPDNSGKDKKWFAWDFTDFGN